jgi:membrane protein DedA with SNARE-associated domain
MGTLIGFRYNHRLMFKGLIDWYLATLKTGGYPLIALLMAIESSVVPLPSEVIIPPAAHLAHTHQAPLGVIGIIVAGALGSWLGATVMYWAARLGGRPLMMRYGRYVLIPPSKIEGAERWADHYGSMGIFISRLLPVVRHLIGIPAGIVRMDYKAFSIYTLLGSGIWCAVLCYVGIKMGQDEQLMKGELHRITLWLGGAMLVLGGMYYFFVHRQMAARTK